MTVEEAQKILQQDDTLYGFISKIQEADYGCEERLPGQPLRCLVELVTKDTIVKKEILDEWLVEHDIDEGSFITKSIILEYEAV